MFIKRLARPPRCMFIGWNIEGSPASLLSPNIRLLFDQTSRRFIDLAAIDWYATDISYIYHGFICQVTIALQPIAHWMIGWWQIPVLTGHCRGFSSRRGSWDPCETVEDEEENLVRLFFFCTHSFFLLFLFSRIPYFDLLFLELIKDKQCVSH